MSFRGILFDMSLLSFPSLRSIVRYSFSQYDNSCVSIIQETLRTLAFTLKLVYLTLVIFTQSISMMAGKLASSIEPAHEPGLFPPNPMFRMR